MLSTIFWLYRMNAALRKFDGVFIIPVLQVVWTLFSIVGGGVYFKEFRALGRVEVLMFTLGVLIVMGGVYLLSPQQPEGRAEERRRRASVQADRLDVSVDEHMRRGVSEQKEGSDSGSPHSPLTPHPYDYNPRSDHGTDMHTAELPQRESSASNGGNGIGGVSAAAAAAGSAGANQSREPVSLALPPSSHSHSSTLSTLSYSTRAPLYLSSSISSSSASSFSSSASSPSSSASSLVSNLLPSFVHPLQIRQMLAGKVHAYSIINNSSAPEGQMGGGSGRSRSGSDSGEGHSGRPHSFSFSSSGSSDVGDAADRDEREMLVQDSHSAHSKHRQQDREHTDLLNDALSRQASRGAGDLPANGTAATGPLPPSTAPHSSLPRLPPHALPTSTGSVVGTPDGMPSFSPTVPMLRSLSIGDRPYHVAYPSFPSNSGAGTGSRILQLHDGHDPAAAAALDRPVGLGDTPTSASSTRSLLTEEWLLRGERRRPRALSFGISMPWGDLDSDDD